MESTRSHTSREHEVGAFTRMLADFFDNFGMFSCCDRKRGPAFGPFMGRCRSWFPAWAARSRVRRDEDFDHHEHAEYDDHYAYDEYDDRYEYDDYDATPYSSAPSDC